MSVSSSGKSSLTAFTAPVLVGAGLVIAVTAWLMPINLKSVSPVRALDDGSWYPTTAPS